MLRPTTMPSFTDRLTRAASRVVQVAATPLAPADYLELFDRLHPALGLRARVVSVDPETRDAATVVLRPGRGWRPHVPGQYVRLGVDVEGVRHWRTYSLTSPPDRDDGCISVTVETVPDGVVSNHLVRRTRPGTVVQLELATGEFVLPSVTPPRTLFVTAGSGITPVMGILRSRLDDLDDVVVVHATSTPERAIFGGELRAMAAAGRLRLVEHVTRREGRLDPAGLTRLVPDLHERETWACGPGALLDVLEEHWDAAGIPERLHLERFRPGTVVTGEGGTVHFRRSGQDVEADGATPLLEAGEAAGVLMPSGCRMGICFGCVVPLREGAVRDLRTGELTVTTAGDEPPMVQTCVNAAAATCSFDL
ncbi:ferredoxin reductase [Egicoccus halophilus]|uniref:Oxidoreductase n=1 Tax=Egicoccus halophilus TaxID=1670830 RepID=A0A8J3A9L1_9ACTN|nr:ferredoxin reductase [Egicoccus halophilus]GGI08158.1 oxidoreductase [Egicoccus halophilus]